MPLVDGSRSTLEPAQQIFLVQLFRKSRKIPIRIQRRKTQQDGHKTFCLALLDQSLVEIVEFFEGDVGNMLPFRLFANLRPQKIAIVATELENSEPLLINVGLMALEEIESLFDGGAEHREVFDSGTGFVRNKSDETLLRFFVAAIRLIQNDALADRIPQN
jgi:hypothetical protein